MKQKVKWGILSTSKIGREKVIPALQNAANCEVAGIASRNLENATRTASDLNISKSYGSYEELLTDPDIDAVYNPLPNHLHLEFTLKALKAGKHVLCEKPIGMNAAEAKILMQESKKYPQLKVMEAFMYKFHPQWIKVKELVKSGTIGKVKNIETTFTYNNKDEQNIRNIASAGGGALMDIGCYCISFPRFILDQEPIQVIGRQLINSVTKTDDLTSGMLLFEHNITASFTCSTKIFPYQRTLIFGDSGMIEIDLPCNTPLDEETKMSLQTENGTEIFTFKANQYILQCEAFADAILNDKKVPFILEDAYLNMKVIDEIKKSSV
ncbi:MAG: Gfo/Idh/MocA family oxidoreductase [Pelobium sp.]